MINAYLGRDQIAEEALLNKCIDPFFSSTCRFASYLRVHIQFLRIYHDGLATQSCYNERVSRSRSDAGVYFKSRQKKTGSQNGR